jgi:hypothetical protein
MLRTQQEHLARLESDAVATMAEHNVPQGPITEGSLRHTLTNNTAIDGAREITAQEVSEKAVATHTGSGTVEHQQTSLFKLRLA